MSLHDEKKSPSIGSDNALEAGIPRLGFNTKVEIEAEEDAHLGVKTVEAAEKVYGRYSKWFLFVGYVHRHHILAICEAYHSFFHQYCPRVLHLLPRRPDDVQLPRFRHLRLRQARPHLNHPGCSVHH